MRVSMSADEEKSLNRRSRSGVRAVPSVLQRFPSTCLEDLNWFLICKCECRKFGRCTLRSHIFRQVLTCWSTH